MSEFDPSQPLNPEEFLRRAFTRADTVIEEVEEIDPDLAIEDGQTVEWIEAIGDLEEIEAENVSPTIWDELRAAQESSLLHAKAFDDQRRENDRLRRRVEALLDENAFLRVRLDRAQVHLVEYSQHKPICVFRPVREFLKAQDEGRQLDCVCGLEEAIRV
jgi:hypothetical protein